MLAVCCIPGSESFGGRLVRLGIGQCKIALVVVGSEAASAWRVGIDLVYVTNARKAILGWAKALSGVNEEIEERLQQLMVAGCEDKKLSSKQQCESTAAYWGEAV